MSAKTYSVQPIGYVRESGGQYRLEILEPFRSGLKRLGSFSHLIVVWWADQLDDPDSRAILECEPPYAPGHVTGVFATRSPLRPNPIAITTCAILRVDETGGVVDIPWIDALDGTPILDLKAYFPVADRVREARLPDWLAGWPEWLEDADSLSFEEPGS